MGSTLLNSDYLAEIGRITAHFAILESTFSKAIAFLLNLDERTGKIVTAELSFRNKMNLLDSLYRERIQDQTLLSELNDLLRTVGQVEERRNQITHSIWGFDPDTQEVVRIKRTAKQGKGLREQGEVMTTTQLNDIANDIDLVERRFTDFMRASFP